MFSSGRVTEAVTVQLMSGIDSNGPAGGTFMIYRILIVLLVIVIVVGYQQVRSQDNSSSYNGLDLVDKAGNIRQPTAVRDRYQALGTYSVVDLNGDIEL